MKKLFKFILTLIILIGLVNDSYSQCAGPPSSTPTLCLGNSLTDITISTSASDISDNGVPGANGLPPGVAANFPSPNTLYLSMSGGRYMSEKYADITLSNPDLDANGIAETPYVTDQVWVYDNQQDNAPLDNYPLPGASGNNGHWNNGQILTPQFGIPDRWVNEPGYSNSDFPQNFPITLSGSLGQSVYFNTWDRYDDTWDGTIWQFTDKPTSDPTHQVVFTSKTPNGGDQTSGSSWDGNPGRLEVTFELLWWNPQPLVGGYSHTANGNRLSSFGGGGGGGSSSTIITISGTPLASGVYNYSIPLIGCAGNATGTITVSPDNTAAAPSATPTLCNNTPLTDITIATTGATGIAVATGLPSGVTASWSADEVTVTGTPSQVGTFNYSVPLTGGCGTVNATGSITVVSIDDPGFNYNSLCYFSNASDPFAQNIMTSGGTFSSSGGIIISNNSTGLIDLSNSLPGNYLITYTTGGTCPQSANANVLIANGNDCNTPTFTPLSDPVAQTVASYLGGNEYQITPSSGSVRGAVWCDQPLNLDYSFTIEAELNFGSKGVSGSNDQGADGISFVLHQNYQPFPVGGIGYAGFDPSIAVEFDTYYNTNIISPATVALDNGAPNSLIDDHMAVQLDGVREHSSVNNLLSPINLGDIEDGQYHNLVLHWDVSSTTLKIYFKNQLIGQVVRDIRNDFTGLVYWGFAASNGAAYNDHRFRYLNSSFWYGRNPTSLSDNINEWQGDVLSPVESITDPIDNTTQYSTGSWFNPCNWTASFVPDYNNDVVIPQQSSYTNHPLVNYDQSFFINHSVLNLDMDADGDVDSDDQIQGKAFAKSLQLEGDALFFIKTDDGADIQVKD